MHVRIMEGRLVETPTGEARGVDYRAFGEFVGLGGELASYALGWTIGSQPHLARLSIGIGAGNRSGGTFHAVVSACEGGDVFSLTDEVFEHVPQGGADLTAMQARAHRDLPFVWAAADRVVQHDRRGWWMRHWLWGTTCIQTLEVFQRREPVLLVGNDDDGLWQLVGATDRRLRHGKDRPPVPRYRRRPDVARRCGPASRSQREPNLRRRTLDPAPGLPDVSPNG